MTKSTGTRLALALLLETSPGLHAVEAPGTALTLFNALRIGPSRPIVTCYHLRSYGGIGMCRLLTTRKARGI